MSTLPATRRGIGPNDPRWSKAHFDAGYRCGYYGGADSETSIFGAEAARLWREGYAAGRAAREAADSPGSETTA